jgi:Flp pilus assembly protein TadD
VISARTLAHHPAKPARREFELGIAAWRKGHSAEAVEHLTNAVRRDSQFIEPRAELGTVYLKIGQPERALDTLEGALEIEPLWAVLHSNKACVFLAMGRWEEAERAARKAVQLDPESIEGNYMLGISMLAQEKITPETASHLKVAAKKYPPAQMYLTQVEARLPKTRDLSHVVVP